MSNNVAPRATWVTFFDGKTLTLRSRPKAYCTILVIPKQLWAQKRAAAVQCGADHRLLWSAGFSTLPPLKLQPHLKLYMPFAAGLRTRDLAEFRILQRAIRHVELRRVKEVRALHAELYSPPFRNGEVLEDGEIERLRGRSVVRLQADIALRERSRRSEIRRVEPLAGSAATGRRRVRAAGYNVGSAMRPVAHQLASAGVERIWHAGTQSENTVHLPIAHDRLHNFIQVRSVRLASPERNLIVSPHRKVVPDIPRGTCIRAVPVGRVKYSQVLRAGKSRARIRQCMPVGVSRLECQTGRQPLL